MRVLWATAGLAVLFSAQLAIAQDMPLLRGEVDEGATSQYLLERDRATRQESVPSLAPAPGAAEPAQADDGDLYANPPDADDAEGTALPPANAAEATPAEAEDEAQAAPPRLPQDDTPTASVRQPAVEQDATLGRARQATRQPPVQLRPRTAPADAYAQPGIRLGTVTLRPSIEQGIRATTNADSSAAGRGATISETTIRLNAATDIPDRSVRVDAYATKRKSLSGQELDETLGAVTAEAEARINNDLTATGTLGYEVRPESANSPNAIEGTANRPLRHTLSASAGVRKDLGKLRLRLTGDVERDTYDDAELSTGATLSQADRDATVVSARLRGGYELSPSLVPFAEVELGRRIYDNRTDSAGYRRSGNIAAARVGIAVDRREKLSGEMSVGYMREDFEDERLAAISGLTLDGALNWSPRRGWDVRLSGATRAEPGTTAGDSGSIYYDSRLAVTHELRENLTTTAALGLGWRDYIGRSDRDLIFSAEAGATWWINRYAGLTGRVTYEKLDSTIADRSYDATSGYLGLTLRR